MRGYWFGKGWGMALVVVVLVNGWCWAQEPQLLVLSEVEERIAGELAAVMLERHLAQRGVSIAPDERVARIGRSLAAYSDRPHLHYNFVVLEGDIPPRAFSLPGGRVYVSRSLLTEICQTDADLAFVLGHEIAHSALRHYADYALLDGQQTAYVQDVLQRHHPLSLFAGSADDDGITDDTLAAAAVEEILLPYMVKVRQLKEFEADQFGTLYAVRAGYDFSGAFWVLRRLQRKYGGDVDIEAFEGMLNLDHAADADDHPGMTERLEQLELFRMKAVEVAELFPLGRDALDRGDYREAALVFESILSLFPQSRTARVGLGVAYHLQYWDSAPGDDFLLAYPGSLELEYLYLLERGPRDVDALRQAIEQYRQVLDVAPGNSYAGNNLGVALAELRQAAEAERAFREALRVAGRDFTMFNLGVLLTRKAAITHDASEKIQVQTEALRLITRYLHQSPHDTVAAQYAGELQERIIEK